MFCKCIYFGFLLLYYMYITSHLFYDCFTKCIPEIKMISLTCQQFPLSLVTTFIIHILPLLVRNGKNWHDPSNLLNKTWLFIIIVQRQLGLIFFFNGRFNINGKRSLSDSCFSLSLFLTSAWPFCYAPILLASSLILLQANLQSKGLDLSVGNLYSYQFVPSSKIYDCEQPVLPCPTLFSKSQHFLQI